MMNCVLAHSLTTFRTSAQGPGHDLGYEVKDEQGRKFVYVQFHNAAANKDVVGWMRSATKNRVTKFIGSSSAAGVAGVMLGSGAAALDYGWIQTEGVGYGDDAGSNGNLFSFESAGVSGAIPTFVLIAHNIDDIRVDFEVF